MYAMSIADRVRQNIEQQAIDSAIVPALHCVISLKCQLRALGGGSVRARALSWIE